MTTLGSRPSSPLAAIGAVLGLLALAGLARGHATLDPPSTAPPPTSLSRRVEPAGGTAAGDAGAGSGQVARLLSQGEMDVNRATATDLQLLPRIGPTLAARIVEDRERRGRFERVGDLARVRGIGPRTLEGLRALVTVEAADP